MKFALKSKTIVGTVLQLVGSFLVVKGVASAEETQQLANNLDLLIGAATEAVGLILSIYGRIKASPNIYLFKKPEVK